MNSKDLTVEETEADPLGVVKPTYRDELGRRPDFAYQYKDEDYVIRKDTTRLHFKVIDDYKGLPPTQPNPSDIVEMDEDDIVIIPRSNTNPRLDDILSGNFNTKTNKTTNQTAPTTQTSSLGSSGKRGPFVRKMAQWKNDLLSSVSSMDGVLKTKAQECSTQTTDEFNGFKDKYMPTREACRVILDPKYEGQCLGADMNKLTCEKLMTDAPNIWKETVVSQVEPQLEEVIQMSTALLNECIDQSKMEMDDEIMEISTTTTTTSSPMRSQRGPDKEVKLQKFFEFYKGYRERSLRTRMDKLKKKMEHESRIIVADACKDALNSKILLTEEKINGGQATLERYHKFVEDRLPQVPVEAAKKMQEKFSELVTQTVHELDTLQEEILDTNYNYNHLAGKLRSMVIDESGCRPRKQSKVLSCGMDDHLCDEDTSRRIGRKKVTSLSDMCIDKCAEYVEYLPELPEGCFPEDVIQKLIDVLINENKVTLNVDILDKLLHSGFLSLSLKGLSDIEKSVMELIGCKCLYLNQLDLSGCYGINDECIFGLLIDKNTNQPTELTRSLKQLNLEGCGGIGNDGIMCIARNCQSLESINLSGCVKVTDLAINELIGNCKKLETLMLKKCAQVTDNGVRGISELKDLCELDLSECGKITNETLVNVSLGCENLRLLKVRSKAISHAGVQAVVERCGKLKVLELTECDVGDETVKLIRERLSANIICLTLSGCRNLSSKCFVEEINNMEGNYLRNSNGFEYFGMGRTPKKFYNLKHLDLSRCLNVGDEVVKAIAESCPNITTINLMACDDVTDEGILELHRNKNYKLKRLILDKCQQVTDKSISTLVEITRDLRKLHLSGCRKITDLTLCKLAACCPVLEDLDLSSCEDITDSGLQQISLGCLNLQHIGLSDLGNLTEQGISDLCKYENMQTIKLSHCKGLTSECLFFIANNCRELKELDISYCTNVSIECMKTCLNFWPRLKVLHLRGWSQITKQGIEHPGLEMLNVSWCKNLEDEALDRIGNGCQNLTSIDLAWCDKVTAAGVHRLAQRSAIRTFNLRGCSKLPFLALQFLIHAGKTVYR
eukprot:TRINITY_DN6465_c0_g2_i1.p1 TRINITY_DN6465_c0_g2~~TRINITY_DN6465_c0_g2_i1.p1  ORF type:complete len:1068 (-),score=208.00 TRINITY_DN6465_c0_g2_i1:85-3288(-)